MVTTTTTYSFKKPTVGQDEDVWGGYLNDSMDLIDDVLDGTTPVTGIDINSGTIDNAVIGGTTPVAGTFTTLTANTSLGVTGNITVSGTVDGRDVAADGTKLDGIESGATADQTAAEIRALVESATDSNVFTDADHTKLNGIETGATADQTASEILTLIKTVDGAGSGLDADTLDGISSASFLRSDASDTTTGNLTISKTNGRLTFYETSYSTGNSGLSFSTGAGQDLTVLHEVSDADLPEGGQGLLIASSGSVAADVHIQLVDGGNYYSGTNVVWHAGNDGSGSGLDADTVDGIQASSFLRSDTSDTFTTLSGTQLNIGSQVQLAESSDRADLLQITSSTSSWGGLQIRNSSNEGRWSFMTDGATAGIYDDENGDWHVQWTENAGAVFYYNGVQKMSIANTYMEMSQHIDLNNYDIYGVDQIFHHGDTNTYMQFHAADQWRVVTGGTERIEVNNSDVTIHSALKEDYDALSGTSPSIDVDAGGGFSLTMTGNTTFTFTGCTSGVSTGFVLELTGNGSTVTWPTSVDWAGGTAPDAPASGETDIYVFWTRDGGTTWYGVQSIDAAA